MNGRLWVIAALIGLLLGAGLGYGVSLNQMNVLQGQITTLGNQVTSLQKLIADITADKAALQEQLTTKTTEVTNLANQIATKDSQIAELEDQATSKNNEISTLTAQVSDLQRQVDIKGAWNTIKTFSSTGSMSTEFF